MANTYNNTMGLLLKGAFTLGLMGLVGFFSAYELTGIVAAEDLGFGAKTQFHSIEKRQLEDTDSAAEPSDEDIKDTDEAMEVLENSSTNVNSTLLDCLSAEYNLTNFCNITTEKSELLGALATFEDLSSVLFIDDVVGDIQTTCSNSSWCLSMEDEKRLYTELGEGYLAFCDLTDCLVNLADECMTPERRLVMASLFLMCRAEAEAATGECLLAIRQMTHVAMADLYKELEGIDQPDSCQSTDEQLCGEACYELGWQLHCMSSICDNNMEMLTEFEHWQWFYSVENAMEQCGINDTVSECENFIQPEVFLVEYGALYTYLDNLNPRVLIGVAIALLTGFGGIGVVIWVCVCRIRRRTRNRTEYHDIKSSEIQALIDSVEDAEDEQLPA